MPGQNASVLLRDADGRVLLIHEAYGARRFGPPGGTIVYAATLVSGTPAPGDPAEIQSVGWYDPGHLPTPPTLMGGHFLPTLAGAR